METLNYADKIQKMNEHLHSNIIYLQSYMLFIYSDNSVSQNITILSIFQMYK